jgi:hypothetical protein
MYDPKSHKISKVQSLVALARRRSREGHLPWPRQLAELVYLWLVNGVRPPDYFAAGLYRADLTWADKRQFLGNGRYMRLLQRVNDKRYEYVAFNKVVTGGVLRVHGIPTPTFYGFISQSNGQTFDGQPLRNSADLASLLRRVDHKTVCFKLVDGWGGRGFFRVSRLDDDPIQVRVEPGNTVTTIEHFWDRQLIVNGDLGYECQAGVTQHPGAAVFHPTSVNTARVWVTQPSPGRWELFAAVFRMGTANRPNDNCNAGGVTAPVDLATGRLGPAINETVERPVYEVHPTSGVPIAGGVVPDWQKIAPLCQQVGEAFPFLRLIGIDVAFGVDGPMILEIEAWPDEDQIGFDRGVRTLLEGLCGRPRPVKAPATVQPGREGTDPRRHRTPPGAHQATPLSP